MHENKRYLFESSAFRFFGLAIGDALGVPVEFKSREYLRDHPIIDMIGYGTFINLLELGPMIVLWHFAWQKRSSTDLIPIELLNILSIGTGITSGRQEVWFSI